MAPSSRPLRVLVVSYWFAPYSTIAAIRASKLAKHLTDQGLDVRVLTAEATDRDTSLPLEIPRAAVTYTRWHRTGHRIEALRTWIRGALSGRSASPAESSSGDMPSKANPAAKSALRAALSTAYHDIVDWPDNRAGWRKHAIEAGLEIARGWRPDVIYATAPPATALLVADQLARKIGAPWIAEMRDLWTDHPYYENSRLRWYLERIWDQRVLSRAAAIVTVSPGWRQRLIDRYKRPVVVAMNGFVAADFPIPPPVAPEASGPLRIVFTGHIYSGFRDPSPLFEAIRRLHLRPDQVLVEFVGARDKAVRGLAERHSVLDHVRIHPPVPYARALEMQLHADVLLHMQWCDPKEHGTIAGKIFDYLGARRPILGIALEDSVVAELIRERDAGLVTNDPEKIAKRLESWIVEKGKGGIAPLKSTASQGLERSLQFERVRELLQSVAAGRA
jgi:glycosyltransferase involved in cell wall biosynthesis